MDQAAKGKKALEESKYEEAISLFTAALAQSPTSPDYLIQRSTALHRAKRYSHALVDAENAVLAAQKRAKRELIVEAQFRRGCALYSLNRYGDAAFIFAVVKRMDEKHKMVPTWEKKAEIELGKLSEDDERRKCTVTETPTLSAGNGTTNDVSTSPQGPQVQPTVHTGSLPAQTPADKIRHDWYQNSDNVYFTLLAKGVPKEKAQIELRGRSLNLSFPLLSGSSYDLTLDPLFGEIVPEKCITRIMPSKVEIILAKAVPGQKWTALESAEPVASIEMAGGPTDTSGIKHAVFTSQPSNGPAYPTSSKSGPKDWDKVTRDAQAELQDPNKKSSLGDDDDDEGGDEANAFFKKLFKDASPDVKRAMMKSYTESNGTALSTNWDEVRKAKVETVPPDGMEAKSWGT